MRTYPIYPAWFSSTATSTDLASSAQKIDYTVAYSVQAIYTGNTRGTMALYASNDGLNFSQIQNSSYLISSSGNYVWNVLSANYDYVQWRFASSATSTGTMQVLFYSKGF